MKEIFLKFIMVNFLEFSRLNPDAGEILIDIYSF